LLFFNISTSKAKDYHRKQYKLTGISAIKKHANYSFTFDAKFLKFV